jgi:lambda family phage portal protein
MTTTEIAPAHPAGSLDYANAVSAYLESYRDARQTGPSEIALWRPALTSADRSVLRDAGMLRARARDLVRNNAYAKNAARMQRDAVSGSGLKLALKIDWRTLGIDSIEAAAEWQDHVTRMWEAAAEGVEHALDARRMRTFSQIFQVVDMTDFVDGEALAVLELKEGATYRTCVNLIDVDRLSNPGGAADTDVIRGGIERDLYGEPLAYWIREGHPHDVGLSLSPLNWRRVPRRTSWGRDVVAHTYDHTRPEMTRGVSEFASAIVPLKMLEKYSELELQSAIVQAAYAAVIKTELDWSAAMQMLGPQAKAAGSTSNPVYDMIVGHMSNAATYHNKRQITFEGAQIPHLLPNESIDVIRSTHPNSGFDAFEAAFLRKLAAGLGIEAHELAKNYKDINYSSARAALNAVWRTYRTRRNRLISQFAMPTFAAWLEEAVALGAVPLPAGVTDFFAARPFLCQGTFIAWGKPLIDPLKERQAQRSAMEFGADTLEEVLAEEGQDWRHNLDQQAYERAYRMKLGLRDPLDRMGGMVPAEAPDAEADTDAEEA